MKNKKHLTIAAISICIAIVCGFLFIFSFMNKNEGENSKVEISQVEGLPKLSQIDEKNNPMLYDFVNSSISYKMDVNPENWSLYYAIMQNQDNPNEIYVEYYSYAEKLTFPTLGTAPVQISLDSSLDSFNDFSSKLSKDRVFTEYNWKMIIISQYNTGEGNSFDYCDSAGRWAGIDLLSLFTNQQIGEMQKTIESGLGWPTEWLRKNPYNETMKMEGYDVSDPFWDKYNIKSSKIYKNDDGQELKVEVDQLDRFKLKINGNFVTINERDLKIFLEQEGWR